MPPPEAPAQEQPPDLLSRPPEEAVRRIALALLAQARAAAARLEDSEDAEALHDFRVAIRRLRSTLRAWHRELGKSVSKQHRRALRRIQRATGAGRDAEVALEWLAEQRGELRPLQRRGHDWLVDHLTQRRARAMDHLCQKVRADFERIDDALRDHLEVLRIEVHLVHAPDRDRFADALSARARRHSDELMEHLLRIASPEDRTECHRARIACKRLRYLVEPTRGLAPEAAAVVKQCKRLQDLLGDLNDAHILQGELASALEEASVEHARRLHEVARDPDRELLQREMRRSPRSGLVELTRRDHLRMRERFEELEKRWIAPHSGALVEAVALLCERLESAATSTGRPPEPPPEPEPGEPTRAGERPRRYLLGGLPDLRRLDRDAAVEIQALEVDEGWLPGERVRERVRRTRSSDGVRYDRRVERDEDGAATSLEEPADAALFDALWPLTRGRRLRKRRYQVREGERVWWIDEYRDRALRLAEPGPAAGDELPGWLAEHVLREVSDDAGYAPWRLALGDDRGEPERS